MGATLKPRGDVTVRATRRGRRRSRRSRRRRASIRPRSSSRSGTAASCRTCLRQLVGKLASSTCTAMHSDPHHADHGGSAPRTASASAAAGSICCGIAPAADHPELGVPPRVARSRGYAGRDAVPRIARPTRRADVRAVMPSARSVISLGTVYNTDRPYSTECPIRRPRGDRALRLGRRLPRRHRAAAGRAGRVAAERCRR